MIKIPPYLQKGDLVLVIATARKRSKEVVAPALKILKSWGLKVETGNNVYNEHHQFAGTDEERLHDLQWAINHRTAKAIFVTGGGYGTIRIIDKVDFKGMLKYPKWFVGFSDVTAIHSRLSNLKIASIHGPVAFHFNKDKKATAFLKKSLFGEKLKYEIKIHELNRYGNVTGKIVGGNLSLLYALSGSEEEINCKNKILFIEDLDEQLYHVDRMMMQFKRSGKLKHLKALMVGGMTEMKDNAVAYGKSAEEIIYDAVKEYNYPVCFNFPAGHIDTNHALYLGREASLIITKCKVSLNYI